MDKAILKKFAIESRKDLIDKIKRKISLLYVEEQFNKENKGDIVVLSNDKRTLTLTKEEYNNREKLLSRIRELGLEAVIEESAYTWFNRIIAIRYMELHDFLPLSKNNSSLGIRVLSSQDNSLEPEILKFSNLINSELDINFNKEYYAKLNKDDKKFQYIMLLICKKLGKLIPQVFGGITDYIDLLIPDNMLSDNGIIYKLINNVPNNNFVDVEIIGWLYQYYNQIEKDRVMSEKRVYKKNEIPYVTELFTPDWIVKYMVENSLGKFAIENGAPLNIKNNWKYYVSEEKIKNQKILPTEITLIDPCCGSGHILVYAFEIFMQIYKSYGYNSKEIPALILEKNIYGIDIDDRAEQLSILSVILKAREYDKDLFNKPVIQNLNIISMKESININLDMYERDIITQSDISYLMDTFKNAKEIGSLLKVKKMDYSNTLNKLENNIFDYILGDNLKPLIKQANLLSSKYDIVVTNPPYLNNSMMSDTMKKYLSINYNDSKTDLCTAFMETNLISENGYLAMINQHSWMFLSSFESLRKKLIMNMKIDSMIHLGTRAFEEIGGEVVQTTTFVFQNGISNQETLYIKLNNYNNPTLKEKKVLEMIKNDMIDDDIYLKNQTDFLKIPGSPIAYWISERMEKCFSHREIGDLIPVKKGADTGDNNKYLRQWYEPQYQNIKLFAKPDEKFIEKWVPYNKGGEYRKWYGNNDIVINWENDGFELKNSKANLRSQHLYFKDSITWSALTSTNTSFRYSDYGAIFDSAGSSMFPTENIYYYLALCNSVVSNKILDMINPTLNFGAGSIAKIPVIFDKLDEVQEISKINIELCKEDWNSFETSWAFVNHPLIEYKSGAGYDNDIKKWNYKIKDAYNSWESNCNEKFKLLKKNEEELNRIFIDIYDLQDELTPEVDDKDITIRKADKMREIKSLISYAVGCMFGRYSLDEKGLVYAGGVFNKDRYFTYKVDEDNIIPISDEDDIYYNDDIVSKFKKFIETVYGKETLNENLDFIADVLGKKDTENSLDTIRRYFVNDFYKDHLQIYQKRPIYWMFDSGKNNGFKCLIYMHRYNEQTISKIRVDYLHKTESAYKRILEDLNYKLDNLDLSVSDKKNVSNKKIIINKKIVECNEYDEKIGHLANKMISIDLDDGVKTNYKKFDDVLDKIK